VPININIGNETNISSYGGTVLIMYSKRTWPAPTLMECVLGLGFIRHQTCPNILLLNVFIYWLENAGDISKVTGTTMMLTLGTSPRPIVLYTFEIRCSRSLTAILRFTQNDKEVTSC
jgi:hypothetical protein